MSCGDDDFGTTEHNFRRIVPGDVVSVASLLTVSLETLGYVVMGSNPLVAKREGGPPLNSAGGFFQVLDSIGSLTIGLRSNGPTSTVATFSYMIDLSVMSRGDRQTLEREADALIAMLTQRMTPSVCPVCAASNSAETKFCRKCGARSVAHEPAEIEVLRLTAGARAAHQYITSGVIALSITALLVGLLVFVVATQKAERVATIMGLLGTIAGLAWMLYGIIKLHLTLNPGKKRFDTSAVVLQGEIAAQPTGHLPPASEIYVTEGTTELLQQPQEKIGIPISRQTADTGEVMPFER